MSSSSLLLHKEIHLESSDEDEDTFSLLGEEQVGASFSSGLINLLKTILGAGILAMPSAMASVGWLLGSLMIVGTALLAAFTLHLYAKCGRQLGRSASIGKLSRQTYPELGDFFDLAVATKCLGVAVTYLIVIGDMLPSIMQGLGFEEYGWWWLSRRFWILVFMVPLSALAMLRRIDSLRYTSFGGLLAVLYLVLLAIWNYLKPDAFRPPVNADIQPMVGLSMVSLRSLPIFIFAFTCHQNLLAIQNEAKDNRLKTMNWMIGWAIGISSLVYLTFSLVSYANFGSIVQSNIFKNYPNDSFEMIFARLLFTLLSAFSYPLQTHPCRASILNIISGRMQREPSRKTYRLVTVTILLLTTFMAMIQDDLSVVSGVIGTMVGIPICYIFPALFYRRLFDAEDSRTYRMAGHVRILGTVMMLACFIALFY